MKKGKGVQLCFYVNFFSLGVVFLPHSRCELEFREMNSKLLPKIIYNKVNMLCLISAKICLEPFFGTRFAHE
jgi:hypothetical protein